MTSRRQFSPHDAAYHVALMDAEREPRERIPARVRVILFAIGLIALASFVGAALSGCATIRSIENVDR